MRSSLFTLFDAMSQNGLRLLGNIILTRILFPEAFGIMALVTVVMTGLRMMSDIGLRASIIQHSRGGDPIFLDTAWTLQIARGGILWLFCLLLAVPVANFYDVPILAQVLPVAGLVAVFQGFNSTKLATADRELLMGRVTIMLVATRVIGLIVLIVLALALESIWALVIGGLVSPFLIMILSHVALPGRNNRFRIERAAIWDLLHFGKYLFLSTLAGFLVLQADRAILGKLVSLEELAFYTIAITLAGLPRLVQQRLFDKVFFPLYTKRPPAESAQNRAALAKARWPVVTASVIAVAILAISGVWIIELLYDQRYQAAGPLLVLMAMASLPSVIFGGYGFMILSAGHSGRYAVLIVTSAVIRVAILYFAILSYGVVGAALSPLIATVLFYPIMLVLIAPYKGWLPKQDLAFSALSIAVSSVAIWINYPALKAAVEAVGP